MSWRRSSRCDSNACVQVWPDARTVWVRDSTGTTLVVDRADWRALLERVAARDI